jgi:peptidoglycan/xylan/chitin deacetylase (PgdA/CDA1 family)
MFHSIYYFLKERRLHHMDSLLKGEKAYWNFDKIVEIEEKHDVRSTFFFLNEQDLFKDRPLASILNPSEWVLYYSSYRVLDPPIAEVIRRLDRGSWEIGLHGSYQSYERGDLIRKEKQTLEAVLGHKIVGVRQHYLRLNIPNTWNLQREAGFDYDSSYGPHRRVETCMEWISPFHPFNTNFVVIPVTIMDGYLFSTCGNDLNLAWERCLEILKWASKNRGVATVLWHSQQFSEQEFPGWPKIYEKIIVEGKRMNAWIAPAGQLYEALAPTP